MKISLGLTTSMPINKSIELARRAEQLGYHRIWVGEDIPSREIFTYLSILALKTDRIPLGIGITNPYVRSIQKIASAVAGIQELSNNRFTMGLGVGGIPEVERLTGRRPRYVVDVLEETTIILKKIFEGEKVDYQGTQICVSDFSLSSFPLKPLDIYFGVRGPKLLELAGRVADGVIFSGPRDYLPSALKIVQESAEAEGRDPGEIKTVLWNGFLFSREDNDLDLAKLMVATMIASTAPQILRSIRLDGKIVEGIRSAFKVKDMKGAKAFIDRKLIDQYCFYGDKKRIQKGFKEFQQAGFEEFILGPPYGKNPMDAIEAFGRL